MKYIIIPIAILLVSCSTRKVNRAKVIDKAHTTEIADLSSNISIDSISLNIAKKFAKNTSIKADSIIIQGNKVNVYGLNSEVNESSEIVTDSTNFSKVKVDNLKSFKENIEDNYSYNKKVEKKSIPLCGWAVIALSLYGVGNYILNRLNANNKK